LRTNEARSYLVAQDVWQAAGVPVPAQQTLVKHLQTWIIDSQLLHATWRLVSPCTWERLAQPSEEHWMVPAEQTGTFLLRLFRKRRVSLAHMLRVFREFGLHVDETLLAQIDWTLPVEQNALEWLRRCLPSDQPLQTQYRVGPYKVDAYLPEYHVAVEIDEGGHERYPSEEEEKRQHTLETHGLQVVRWNPDEEPAEILLRRVWQATLRSSRPQQATLRSGRSSPAPLALHETPQSDPPPSAGPDPG